MKNTCMKILSKLIISMTIIFAMVSGLFGTASADMVACMDGVVPQRNNKTLNVNRKKGKIVLDGKAKEKAWDNATVIKNSDFSWGLDSDVKQFKTKSMDTAKSEDIAEISSCKMLWAPNGFYIYMKVKDTTPYTADDKLDDSVAYYFDMTNKKATAYSGINDVNYTLSRNGRIGGWGELNSRGFKGSSVSVDKGKDGYTQEIFVACDWHGVESLKKGGKVGFDLQIYDMLKEEFEAVTRHIVWNSIDLAWTNPATMGTLVLVGVPKKSLEFVKRNIVIKKGKTKTLKAKVVGANKVKFVLNKKGKKIVKFSNKKAKSVVVQGKKKGTAVIQAKIAGKVAKCTVKVK